MTDDDTSLWLLTDLARCTTCWQLLQPYTCARRRFYVCFCFTLYEAAYLEALVVGHAAAHDRRTAVERPFITYRRWHQATRTDLRRHLLRMVDHALVHTPHTVELRWHSHIPAATAVYQTWQGGASPPAPPDAAGITHHASPKDHHDNHTASRVQADTPTAQPEH